MRKSLCYTVFLVLITTFGCETDKILFKGPYHVRFTEATGFAKESVSDTVKIEVHNVGPALENDVNISYEIGGNAREGVDYVILNERKRVTIKAGEYFSNILIKLVNNSNNILRAQNIVLTILSANSSALDVGQGASQIGRTYTFTIFDDCILGGTYVGRSGVNGSPYRDLTLTGSASSECVDYVLSNWNIDAFNIDEEMDLNFKDNGDNTLTVPEQEETELPTELATISGTGVVDPTTGDILFKIILQDFDDKPEVSFTLKRQ